MGNVSNIAKVTPNEVTLKENNENGISKTYSRKK